MLKALSEPKPKPETNPKPKPKTEPKAKILLNKKKLENIRKDIYELRHKFSKKEINRSIKAFYDIKIYKHRSISKIKEDAKNLSELKKSLKFKKNSC